MSAFPLFRLHATAFSLLCCLLCAVAEANAPENTIAVQPVIASTQADSKVAEAILEEAHGLIYSEALSERLKHGHGSEVLKAKCALLSFRRQPVQSHKEARALKEPFYASLALGGMAARLQKSDPIESEKLFNEAEQLALQITHWAGQDATSIGYLYRLIPGYDTPRAHRLWAKAAPALIKWDSYGQRSQDAMRELSVVTIQINPEAVESFWKTYVPAIKNHYWDSAEILARAITKKSPAAARKQLDEWLKTKASGHNVTAFRRAILAEEGLGNLPATMAWIKSMRPEARMEAAFDLALLLLYTGRATEARQVTDFLEQEAQAELNRAKSAKAAKTKRGTAKADTTGMPDVEDTAISNAQNTWLNNLIPRLRERLKYSVPRRASEVAIQDTLDIVLNESMPFATTPAMIEAFIKEPKIGDWIWGGIDVLQRPRIEIADGAQAERLIAAALPLAEKIMDGGYPMHGSPRSTAFGTLALIQARRGHWQQANDLIQRITIPELKAFYLLEAYEIAHPLPETVQDWPLHFWPRTMVRIGG